VPQVVFLDADMIVMRPLNVLWSASPQLVFLITTSSSTTSSTSSTAATTLVTSTAGHRPTSALCPMLHPLLSSTLD
jgi:hypothetical protein